MDRGRATGPASEDDPDDVGGRNDRLLSWEQVENIASISRSTAWRMERDGLFPGRVRVSPGRVGWWESELTRWKRSRGGDLPPAPSRTPARVPKLPGMARSRPTPKTVLEPVSQSSDPDPVEVRADHARSETRGRTKAKPSPDQIDFGF